MFSQILLSATLYIILQAKNAISRANGIGTRMSNNVKKYNGSPSGGVFSNTGTYGENFLIGCNLAKKENMAV